MTRTVLLAAVLLCVAATHVGTAPSAGAKASFRSKTVVSLGSRPPDRFPAGVTWSVIVTLWKRPVICQNPRLRISYPLVDLKPRVIVRNAKTGEQPIRGASDFEPGRLPRQRRFPLGRELVVFSRRPPRSGLAVRLGVCRGSGPGTSSTRPAPPRQASRAARPPWRQASRPSRARSSEREPPSSVFCDIRAVAGCRVPHAARSGRVSRARCAHGGAVPQTRKRPNDLRHHSKGTASRKLLRPD
jgi:hypothetical protein